MDNKTNKILLPRGYLSWSAYSSFKQNKEEYIRHYFYGEPGLETAAMDFGKDVARHLELKIDHRDHVLDLTLKSIKRLPKPEAAIKAKLPSQWGHIPLLGKLDDYDPETHAFNEFKTGKRKWTSVTAHNHGQMKFYALILWLNYGVISQPKNLIWIETEWTPEGIKPTGRIQTFPVRLGLTDILMFGKDVVKVAREISDLYQKEINQNV